MDNIDKNTEMGINVYVSNIINLVDFNTHVNSGYFPIILAKIMMNISKKKFIMTGDYGLTIEEINESKELAKENARVFFKYCFTDELKFSKILSDICHIEFKVKKKRNEK